MEQTSAVRATGWDEGTTIPSGESRDMGEPGMNGEHTMNSRKMQPAALFEKFCVGLMGWLWISLQYVMSRQRGLTPMGLCTLHGQLALFIYFGVGVCGGCS